MEKHIKLFSQIIEYKHIESILKHISVSMLYNMHTKAHDEYKHVIESIVKHMISISML